MRTRHQASTGRVAGGTGSRSSHVAHSISTGHARRRPASASDAEARRQAVPGHGYAQAPAPAQALAPLPSGAYMLSSGTEYPAESLGAHERQSVGQAVERELARARSLPVTEYLDEMEDRITDIMDVTQPFDTMFASHRYAAEDLERVQRLVCRQVVTSANDHVVFEPQVCTADDHMAVLLTILYVRLPVGS